MITFFKVPSKLFLFGEHSILMGMPAVILPLWDFTSQFKFPEVQNAKFAQESNSQLKVFLNFLKETDFNEYINLENLENCINKGLYLQSDIPLGCGLGSSAGVCVSVYKSFGHKFLQTEEELREFYSRMESYFHGKSSGIDPLTVHSGKAVLVNNTKIKYLTQKVRTAGHIYVYLLNSGVTRNSSEMISTFRNMYDRSDYRLQFQKHYLPILEEIIGKISSGENILWENLQELSNQQAYFFRNMIPDSIFEIWKQSLNSQEICFKILGAGGGGFFLVFSKKKLIMLRNYELKEINGIF